MSFLRYFCTFLLILGIMAMPAGAAEQSHNGEFAPVDVTTETIRSRLKSISPGPEHDFWAGMLATRTGQDNQAAVLFTRALPSLVRTDPKEAGLAMRLLADTYDRMGQFARSTSVYDELKQSGLMKFLPEVYQAAVRDDSELARVLAGSPPESLVRNGPVHILTSRSNPLKLITTKLTVNGVESEWLIDTGANQSVISQTLATKLQLQILPGTAHTASGVTGIENPMHVALLPELHIGTATARNVPVLVLDDAALTIALRNKEAYLISGAIGLPVLRALGCVTFYRNGSLEAKEACSISTRSSKLEFHLLTPVVEGRVQNHSLAFTLDTGAQRTILSERFYEEFSAERRFWKRVQSTNGGAGGFRKTSGYRVPSLTLTLGGQSVTVHNLTVLPDEQHSDVDTLFGNVGEDILQSVSSFTLDFTHMRFLLETSPH